MLDKIDGVAEATRKSGGWLVCRVGCTQCCVGPFPISQVDARRLRHGLIELEALDPERGSRVRERARQSVARISSDFPGDPATGILAEDEDVVVVHPLGELHVGLELAEACDPLEARRRAVGGRLGGSSFLRLCGDYGQAGSLAHHSLQSRAARTTRRAENPIARGFDPAKFSESAPTSRRHPNVR